MSSAELWISPGCAHCGCALVFSGAPLPCVCFQSQSIPWGAMGIPVYLWRVIRRQLPWKGS